MSEQTDVLEITMPLWQRILLPFIMERKGKVWATSLGIVSWWITLGSAMYTWLWLNKEIQDNHFWLLTILAGYNFGKKIMEKIKSGASLPTVQVKRDKDAV